MKKICKIILALCYLNKYFSIKEIPVYGSATIVNKIMEFVTRNNQEPYIQEPSIDDINKRKFGDTKDRKKENIFNDLRKVLDYQSPQQSFDFQQLEICENIKDAMEFQSLFVGIRVCNAILDAIVKFIDTKHDQYNINRNEANSIISKLLTICVNLTKIHKQVLKIRSQYLHDDHTMFRFPQRNFKELEYKINFEKKFIFNKNNSVYEDMYGGLLVNSLPIFIGKVRKKNLMRKMKYVCKKYIHKLDTILLKLYSRENEDLRRNIGDSLNAIAAIVLSQNEFTEYIIDNLLEIPKKLALDIDIPLMSKDKIIPDE